MDGPSSVTGHISTIGVPFDIIGTWVTGKSHVNYHCILMRRLIVDIDSKSQKNREEINNSTYITKIYPYGLDILRVMNGFKSWNGLSPSLFSE